ncbi:MAG: MATE family efflux transporter [Candidatus Eremiobacteraeota bacterium]|nr:MATE family efflux transporter [Candidatus Eremiobacteraeota bacterium]
MLVFLVPLMLSNILQSASATLNSIFLGRMIGVKSLAAVSAFFPLLFFLISFIIGLSSGSTVLIGQAYGAHNDRRMKQIAGTALSLSVLAAVLVAIPGALVTNPILAVTGTPPDIIATSESYARIIFLSLPLLFAYLMYTTFLRGTGDAQTPFYFLIVSTLLTLVTTPALIRGWAGLPPLGTDGAAVSGIVANGVAFVLLLGYLAWKKHPLRFDREMLGDLRPNWGTALAIVRIGVPTGIQVVMVSLSEIAVISFVNRYGSDATAAYGAVNQVVSYVQFPAISIGIAASIFGAQTIGAGRLDRLGGIVRSAVGLNYAIGGFLVTLVYGFSWIILGLFLTSKHTLDIAHALLMITLWSYLIFGNNAVLSGLMRSSGAVLWPTLLAIVSIWGVEVPVAYALSQRIGIDGIWIAYPVAFIVNFLFQSTYYRVFWKRREIRSLV